MKRKNGAVLLVALMLVIGLGGLGNASPQILTIKVQGTGDVRVTPTKVQMWIGTQTEGATAAEALAKSNETVQRLLEAFANFAPSEVIKTSEFNMYQRERWDEVSRQSVPEGFSVRHVFEVQLFDLTKLAPFLDQSTAAGANIIYGLQYGVKDQRPPREAAYALALEDAWWKARLLAEKNGALDLVLDTVEESQYYSPDLGALGLSAVFEQADLSMPGQLKIAVGLNAVFKATLGTRE